MADIDSVYTLVTKLCESELKAQQKQVNNNTLKKLRSKTFEILLYKQKLIHDPYWLENCNDYHCQFLAWEFILKHTHKQNKMADAVENCVQIIMASDYDPNTIRSILHFFLKLKRPPNNRSLKKETMMHPQEPIITPYKQFSSKCFEITNSQSKLFSPDLSAESDFKLNLTRSFSIHPSMSLMSRSRSRSMSRSVSSAYRCGYIPEDIAEDCEEHNSEAIINIWDVMSKAKFSKRRTWEALGKATVYLEKLETPFLSDANLEIYGLVEKMRDLRECQFNVNGDGVSGVERTTAVKVLTKEEYMKDIRLVVVGIQSNTFKEEKDVFILNENIRFEGISYNVFRQYAMLMINVGICYKALAAMVALSIDNQILETHGFIYSEFYSAVHRYLMFYRAAALNIHSTKGLIEFHAHIRKLSVHLLAVASICQVGTFNNPKAYKFTNSTLIGLQMMNLLYKSVFTQSNRQILFVLNALLFPCLQIYFIKHLNPWLFEGIINDPCEEFFIRPIPKYLQSRGRTYWTRSFRICEETIPDFCRDYAGSIFECGQITNLLKLCVPKAHIFEYLKDMSCAEKETFMQCCITEAQMKKLERKVEFYELDVIGASGVPFSLKRMMQMKKDEALVFNRFLAARKATSIKRIQMEKLEQLSKANEIQRVPSHSANLEEFENKLKEEQAIREKEAKIIKNEAESMIMYYDALAETANKLDEVITKHNETIKNINLNDCVPLKKSAKKPTNIQIIFNAPKSPKNTKRKPKGSPDRSNKNTVNIENKISMSDAQRNKLNLLATEYGHKFTPPPENNTDLVQYFDPSWNSDVDSEENINYDADSLTEQTTTDSFHNYIKPLKFELTRLDSSKSLLRANTDDDEFNPNDNKPDPMRIPLSEVSDIQFKLLDKYISRSIHLPMRAQMSLVKAELLKHFVLERNYLTHLENLRNFYFLLDGEFARVLTDSLFERINDLSDYDELFNQKVLSEVMYKAKRACSTQLDAKQRLDLEFIVMPKILHLSDVFILDCVSLTYETRWPLNILLPSKAMKKYDLVFTFLMKLHRVSWVMKRVFMDMKLFKKEYGRQAILVTMSHQYQKLQLWRHIMTHFVQTFQNYIIGEVLRSSWNSFQEILTEIVDFDELYNAHGIYMRQINFLCLLHQKTSPVHDIIMNIFGIFLKFHDFMRSREWKFDGVQFVHQNYLKMECIFNNFLALAKYFLKICRKIARAAYQPQFTQLVDLMDFNLFYSHLTAL